MLVKYIGKVKTKPSNEHGIGFQYVTMYYCVAGILPVYIKQEILALAA